MSSSNLTGKQSSWVTTLGTNCNHLKDRKMRWYSLLEDSQTESTLLFSYNVLLNLTKPFCEIRFFETYQVFKNDFVFQNGVLITGPWVETVLTPAPSHLARRTKRWYFLSFRVFHNSAATYAYSYNLAKHNVISASTLGGLRIFCGNHYLSNN